LNSKIAKKGNVVKISFSKKFIKSPLIAIPSFCCWPRINNLIQTAQFGKNQRATKRNANRHQPRPSPTPLPVPTVPPRCQRGHCPSRLMMK